MGRRDAVQVTLEVIARMRQLEPRLVVSYEPGWETRGNGTSANYEGGIVHHTAGASSLAKPFPTQKTLRDGRPDLAGPLCNEAGPACTVEQPRIHVVAANPANHAGASGGRSMGPLPVTSLFNPRVRGLEIDYSGTAPMLAGQLYVAHLWARANADVVGGGDINRIRAHFETSVTGKYDIGYAPGKSYDMAAFRRDAATATVEGDDMAQKDIDEIQRKLSLLLGVELVAGVRDSRERTPGEQFMQAAIPNANGDTKATVAVTTVGNLLQDVQANAWYAGRESGAPVVDVDEEALAAELLPQLTPLLLTHLDRLSVDDIDRIKIAVADEQAKRQAS